MALPPGTDVSLLPHVTGVFNLVAFLAIAVVTAVLIVGIQGVGEPEHGDCDCEACGCGHLPRAWHRFSSEASGTCEGELDAVYSAVRGAGTFGMGGITAGAASVFFAYIGFDAVSTAAQEAKNPKRDMPIGILGSLVICTVLYILVSAYADRAGELPRAECGRSGCGRHRCDGRAAGARSW